MQGRLVCSSLQLIEISHYNNVYIYISFGIVLWDICTPYNDPRNHLTRCFDQKKTSLLGGWWMFLSGGLGVHHKCCVVFSRTWSRSQYHVFKSNTSVHPFVDSPTGDVRFSSRGWSSHMEGLGGGARPREREWKKPPRRTIHGVRTPYFT